MKIYRPMVANGYEWINCQNQSDYDVLASLGGSTRFDDWEEMPMRLVTEDEGEVFRRSDFPWLGAYALILRENAVTALRELLEDAGELLPMRESNGTPLFMLNVTRILDALDEEQSKLVRFSSGRIMRIDSPVFHQSTVEGADIFRLPHRATPTYVSDRFVALYNESNLSGLRFDVVWESS